MVKLAIHKNGLNSHHRVFHFQCTCAVGDFENCSIEIEDLPAMLNAEKDYLRYHKVMSILLNHF